MAIYRNGEMDVGVVIGQLNADNLSVTLEGISVRSFLYGYDGSNWDRLVTSAAGLLVDTELPAAATLADGVATPTTPMVGANLMVYNGSTWDMGREGATAGSLLTDVVDRAARDLGKVDIALFDTAITPGDGVTTPTTSPPVASFGMVYNGGTWDMMLEGAIAGSIIADTELPAAAALADGAGNPTTPIAGAALLGWNTSTWDRLTSTTTNGLDVDVTRVIPGTAATHLGKAVDTGAGATDTGVAALAVRDDALGGITPAAGDYATLLVDANGALWTHDDALDAALDGSYINVNCNIAGTDFVGGAGAVAAGVQRVTLASNDPAVTALELLDNALYIDDADWVDNTSSHLLVGGLYQSGLQTITDGDVGPIQVDVNGRIIVSPSTTLVVDTELPAAAGLTDDFVTPTAPAVGAFGMVYDGSAWDMMRGTSGDGVLVNLGANNDVTTELPAAAALADGAGNPTTPTVGAALLGWNTGTWDRLLSTVANGLDVDVTRVIPGTGATNLGKAIDSAVGATDTGVALLGQHGSAATHLTTAEGDYDTVRLSDFGAFQTAPEQHFILDSLNATTGWTAFGNDTLNLATTLKHVLGTNALTFDKVDGAAGTVFAGIQKTISSADLGTVSPHDLIQTACYIPDLTDVAYVFVRVGTDSTNYNEWRIADEALTAATFEILLLNIGDANYAGITGNGWNPSAITYIAVGVAFDAENDALAGIVFDELSFHTNQHTSAELNAEVSSSVSSANVNLQKVGGSAVDKGAGNASNGSQRVVLATDDVNALAIKNAVELLDDTVYIDDADWVDGTSKHLLVGGLYQSAPQAVTDGDVAPFEIDVNGRIIVSPSTPLDVSAATVTVDLGTDNDVVVDGTVAHDALDSGGGGPVKIGGRAQEPEAQPEEVADNDRVDALFDRNGYMRVRGDLDPSFADINDALAGDNTIVAAAGAGKRIAVWSYFIISDGTVDARWEDGAAGTAFTGQEPLQVREGWVSPAGGLVPLFVGSANTLLNLELSAAVACHGSVSYSIIDD